MAESLLFADLLGQPLAVDLLAAALRRERLAPAYLFAGPDGVGRRLAAQRFLEGVLTGGETSERERRRLESGNHPDLLWWSPRFSIKAVCSPVLKPKRPGSAAARRRSCGWSRSGR